MSREQRTLNHQNPITNYINVGIKKGRRKRNADVGKLNAKPGRKRKHDQSRQEKRDNKYSNISYINSKDQQVLPKVFEDFNCNCKLKCPENIPAAQRLQEFEKFHSLGTYSNQNLYLLERVEENFKKRCYTRNKESKTQRTFSRIYHINDVRVCKEMFVKTFQISSGRVSTVLNKVRKGDGLIDRRGTANGGHNRTSSDLVDEVINHIKYALKTKGMPNKQPKCNTLQPERTTIKSMYEMYKKDKLTPGVVSFSTYKAMYYKHLKSGDYLQSFNDEPKSNYLKPGDCLQSFNNDPKSKNLIPVDCLQSFNDEPKCKYLKPGDCLQSLNAEPSPKRLKSGICLQTFNDDSKPKRLKSSEYLHDVSKPKYLKSGDYLQSFNDEQGPKHLKPGNCLPSCNDERKPIVIKNIVLEKNSTSNFSSFEHLSFSSHDYYDDVKNVPSIQFHNVSTSETIFKKSNEARTSKQFHDVFVSETNLKKSHESKCLSEPVMLKTPQCYENVNPPPEIIFNVKVEQPSNQELVVTKRRRKVKGRKVGLQTREERKNNKYSNTEYINTKNEKVLPKIFKEFDCHCNNKCAENITVDAQSKLFEQFHNLGSYSAQNLFLLESVEEIHKKRCYTKNKQKQERTYTRIYTFNKIKVCKEFFVKTLQISPSRVNTVLAKIRDGQGLADQRGVAIGGHNRISHESRIEVIHHISTIVTSISPNRMDTKVGCPFPPEYTFKKMYDMYKGSYQSEVVSFSTYKAIFYKEFGRPTMDWEFTM